MNENPTQRILVPVIVAGVLYIIGQYIASNPAREQQAVDSGREITVTGEAELSAQPDIAKVTLGVQTNAIPTAEAALESLTGSFNQVFDALRELGIAEEDIKTTNFSVYPTYDYDEGRQIPRGFIASEHVVVTVRNLEQVGNVIAQGTATGANQVGGVAFTVSNESDVRGQAEEEAIDQAREKAQRLAKALGATLGDVKKYEVSSGGVQPPIAYERLAADSGGDAPQVPPGTNDIAVTVTITYQLR